VTMWHACGTPSRPPAAGNSDRPSLSALTSNFVCAPSRIRTCDLPLRRHFRHGARRRWAAPDVLFSCTDTGWTWLGVAWYLSLLAPRLAPRDLGAHPCSNPCAPR